MGADSNVVALDRKPARLRPEMQIRWLMSVIDKVEQVAFVIHLKGEHPMVSVSDGCSQYFLALAATILDREALKGVANENGPYKDGPRKGK